MLFIRFLWVLPDLRHLQCSLKGLTRKISATNLHKLVSGTVNSQKLGTNISQQALVCLLDSCFPGCSHLLKGHMNPVNGARSPLETRVASWNQLSSHSTSLFKGSLDNVTSCQSSPQASECQLSGLYCLSNRVQPACCFRATALACLSFCSTVLIFVVRHPLSSLFWPSSSLLCW